MAWHVNQGTWTEWIERVDGVARRERYGTRGRDGAVPSLARSILIVRQLQPTEKRNRERR